MGGTMGISPLQGLFCFGHRTQGVALGWHISPLWGFRNCAISPMEVIEELIKLAKEMDAAIKRGEDLGLTDDEVALTPSLPLSRAAPIASRCLPA